MRYLEFNNLKEQKNLLHLITKKDPKRPLDFSLALHTGDDKNKILQNRATLSSFFPPKSLFISLSQTHSSDVFIAREKKSIGWSEISPIKADSAITNQKGVVLTILTADCVPILLFDPKKKAIGAVHSGWRGTEQNIIKKTIKAMQREFDSNPKDLIVGVGPSIRVCCYEVGDEVAERFQNYPKALSKRDKFHLDVTTICKEQLLSLGVREQNIEINQSCTFCKSEDFFSYRRDKTKGRFISAIALV